MDKLSAAELHELFSEAPGMIRKLASERDFYKDKYEATLRREEAEKVASTMHSKGINMDTPMETLVANLEKSAAEGKLERIREAVDMVGPDMGAKLAQLTNDGQRNSAGASDFERFIVGDVG